MARVISNVNSTDVPLGPAGVFAPPYEDCSQFTVSIQADADSDVFGIVFFWSNDGVTDTIFDEVYTFAHTFGFSGQVFTAPVQGNFFKIQYTNNPFVPQALFSLKTIYSYTNAETRRRRLGDTTSTDEQAQIVRAVLNFFGDPVLPGIILPVKCGPNLNPAVDIEGNVAVTVADGADVALGAKANAAASSDTGTFSLIALFKRLLQKFTTQFPAALVGGRFDVNVGSVAAASGAAYTDRSLAVTTGGTAQQLMAANAARKTYYVVNPMDIMETIWINDLGGTAAVGGLGSVPVFPGGWWSPVPAPLGAVSVLAPTTGKNVTAGEA